MIFDIASPLQLPSLQGLLTLAAERGCKAYMVGGYLRDVAIAQLHGQTKSKSPDYDFVIEGGSAVELARETAERLSGHFVLLDESFDTARVVLDDCQIDFAGCTGSGLQDDLKRRDFTINALALDPAHPDVLIDTVGGMDDIKSKSVRLISEGAVVDDPLRILRAWRFAASLGFSIESDTRVLLERHMGLLNRVALERVSYELFVLFESDDAAVHLKDMGSTGALEKIFPELKATRRVTSNAYHHLDLFDHQIEAVKQCEGALSLMPARARRILAEPMAHGLTRFGALKISCLLHDIGKPDTWVITEEGKHTFIGHDKLGAELCVPLAKRMKWSKPLERFVEKMVRWHLRPGQLFHQGDPTDRAVLRFYRSIGDDVPELILLALSDFRATCGPGLQVGREQAEQKLLELLERYFVYVDEARYLPRLLDGKDVMALLGITAGPVIGSLLEALEEAKQLGEVSNRREAEEFVRRLHAEKYSR